MRARPFVSAGGYHHHVGFNTWRGEGVSAVPPGVVGLREWTVILEDESAVAEVREGVRAAGIDAEQGPTGVLVRDPWGNAVRFAPGLAAG